MTPPGLGDGGFAFSDVLALRGESWENLVIPPFNPVLSEWKSITQPATGKSASNLACFTERLEILSGERVSLVEETKDANWVMIGVGGFNDTEFDC
jgi:hypothetical protein